ncbi:Na+/H+ antiporter subunit E [Micromonospora sp. WMMD882]|uniref:Na+/H+ antiporter subunit E n=1 Tax=Micromonospora sp. WMMD882 TaxID=3015151 RepID=UPI00248C589B|nr:Na+/H+ antiporter subunit E [Micromonospora sp. WMMD882]WBB81827.1 Na+/H+ antiporter subunit E [Micromonospora sp. WMMD882]
MSPDDPAGPAGGPPPAASSAAAGPPPGPSPTAGGSPSGPSSAADGSPPGPPTTADAPPVRGPGGWREQIIAAGWMVLLWNLLWGRFHLGNVLGGALVAIIVLVFFPLPPVTLEARLRPGALLAFVTRFVGELVRASVHVAWTAVRPGYRPRSAIIAAELRVRTDLNLALTAEVVSLVPGTLVLEVDRNSGVLYVHVFDVRAPEDLSGSRQRVRDVERRIVRAVGSSAEVRLLASRPVEKGSA